MSNKYGVVETTFTYPARNFSMMNATEDIENGALIHKGELVPTSVDPYANYIYEAKIPDGTSMAAESVYLVADPAWNYDNNTSVDKNEDNYINKAESVFRTYELIPHNKFAITDYSIDPIDAMTPIEVGQYLGLQAGSTKMKAYAAEPTGSAFVGYVERIEARGAVYNVGKEVNLAKNMVVIRIVKNG